MVIFFSLSISSVTKLQMAGFQFLMPQLIENCSICVVFATDLYFWGFLSLSLSSLTKLQLARFEPLISQLIDDCSVSVLMPLANIFCYFFLCVFLLVPSCKQQDSNLWSHNWKMTALPLYCHRFFQPFSPRVEWGGVRFTHSSS